MMAVSRLVLGPAIDNNFNSVSNHSSLILLNKLKGGYYESK